MWRPRSLLAVACAVLGAAAPAASAQQPTTSRTSLGSSQDQGDGASSSPTTSADGRFAAFVSSASTLVPGDTNGTPDVFLRDRATGQTRRLNVGPGGEQTSGAGVETAEVNADGRVVVFRSSASGLVPGVTGARLYRFDRVAGALTVVPAAPSPYANPFDPSLSADGGRVAFTATGSQGDVFVADLAAGTVRRVSESPSGAPAAPAGAFGSFDPDISADGRWVGFTSEATNLGPPDANGYRDVYVRDLQTGATTRVSVGAGAAEANLHSSTPALSRDGCIVAFYSSATNLVADVSTSGTRVYVRDRCGSDTELASRANGGTPASALVPIDVSDDGCLVAFRGTSGVSPAPAGGAAAVLRDRCAGTTARLDLATSGDPGDGSVADVRLSGGTGRYVALQSTSTNLVPGDTNGVADTFVRDRGTNTAPVAELTVAVDGRRVTADATASRDPDGYVLTGSVSFGDGSPEQPGLQATREYPRGGTYSVSVTIKDADGVSSTRSVAVTVPEPGAVPVPLPPPVADVVLPPPPGADPPAPLVLDRLTLSRSRWSVVPRGGSPGGIRGARLALRLSARATVTVRFERARSGRRAGSRCVLGRRRGARCTAWTSAGTLTRTLRAGTSTLVLTGRAGTRALQPGRHRLRVGARSADGRTTATRTLTLTIVPARRS